MFVKHAAFAASVALLATGCSGSHGNATQSQASAQAPQEAPSAASAAGGTVASNLPIYPDATKLREQMHGPMKMCGTKMSTTVYSVADADATTVAKWYKDRIPNSTQISTSTDSTATDYEIFRADGSEAAVVIQTHFGGSLAKAAKSLGADKTTFATETFDPPLSREIISLLQQGTSGDAASKQTARAQLKAKCGTPLGP